MNRNKKIIMILSTLFTVVLAISFTYAFFYYGKEGSTITLEAGSIAINFEEETNYFTIHDTYPKSDTMGMIDVNYYDFTVSGSKGAEDDILYEIQIEQLEGNTIQEEYVSVYLTDQDDNELGYRPKKLTDLSISKYNGNRVVYDNYICTENQVEDYRLRIWVNEDYTENVQNTFNFKVVLYAVNDDANTLYETVEETLSSYLLEKDGEEDYDARIVSGSKDDENLKNYVWYSGKLWRIVALNNNGTIKMVTDNNITTIAWGANTTYEGSWIYQWLNEDFKDTLYNYKNLLVEDYEWNATETTSKDKSAKTTMVPGTVGLLNIYEYVKSYNKIRYELGYLNNGYYWWLITPYSSSYVWHVVYNGSSNAPFTSSDVFGVRPAVNLKSNILVMSGDGSKEKPYTIKGDIDKPSEDELLNKRVSGEYMIFDNELYRIVSTENYITKITKVDYIREGDAIVTKSLSNIIKYGTGTTNGYWDYYLNNEWYNAISDNYRKMLVTNDWYLGTVGSDTSDNYKNSICKTQDTIETTKYCKKTDVIYRNYVGLGRIGEMFTSQFGEGYGTSTSIWTITPYNSSNVRPVYYYGYGRGESPSRPFATRPSLNLSSDVKIKSGTGTFNDPFKLVLDADKITDAIKSKVGTNGLVVINTNGELVQNSDTIREYRYSGSAKYCTYTISGKTYQLEVDGDSCPSACYNSPWLFRYDNEMLTKNNGTCNTEIKPNQTVPLDGKVNNYIWFNNEMWRIIGVFNENTSKGKKELVKIIRDEPLLQQEVPETYNYKNTSMTIKNNTEPFSTFKYAVAYWNYDKYFGQTNMNDWTKASLQYYLNDETSNANSYYNSINKQYSEMIESVNYKLGNISLDYKPNGVYSLERTGSVHTNNQTEWLGKIALAYPSDYGYASSNESWNNLMSTYGRIDVDNPIKNWINRDIGHYEWFLSPTITNNYATRIPYMGRLSDYFVNDGWGGVVSPVLYLKSEVQLINGDGTESNPYKIAM